MVLTKIADEVLGFARGIYGAGANLLGESTIRLGVTGLAHSGKTTFITSLVANLLDRGRMPHFSVEKEGRILAVYLQPQPDDTVPRFEFEKHMSSLMGMPPRWPDSTRSISELRVSLRLIPNGIFSNMQSPHTVHLDIIDYPGEWLLDLGLLEKSYDAWSSVTLERINARSCGAPYQALIKQTDVSAGFDEMQAKALAASFTEYLSEARNEGFYDCTPGRFLLPGELAGSPVLTFAPLPLGDEPRKSLRREMARRFQAYKSQVIQPFFRDHFSKIDRQVVLIDALGAIHSGPSSVEDMRNAVVDILTTFQPGQNKFINKLFKGKRVEKILFAATKADHLHHEQHGKLTAITDALVRHARDRASFAGADTAALSLAALRATTEEIITHEAKPLGVVLGTLLDSGKNAAFYPGTLPDDPGHLLNQARSGMTKWLDEDYEIMRFAPASIKMRPGDGPPHIRMDRAIQFLIGDRL
ncbi:MAG: YcjX family protein [Tateyamaria sp.]|nr:YcjX family protein [Tateyamaria sp.]MDG1420948.1 YcjX family protein [Tateyamaria sp.]MDG2379821.1 YcjX family protein [Tateyamaria sp.]